MLYIMHIHILRTKLQKKIYIYKKKQKNAQKTLFFNVYEQILRCKLLQNQNEHG